MSAVYTVKPITDFGIFTTPAHLKKPTRASWPKTLKDLERELEYLHASDVILEIGVMAGDIRLDGHLRSGAKVAHPGVRLSFQARDHGALSYSCDTYEGNWAHQMPDWQANVRAIVLTLEALRAVDRYGATKGEQYAGFKELTATASGMGPDGARGVLLAAAGVEGAVGPRVYRLARANAHPDRHAGDRTMWDRVEQAGRVLGLDS